MAAFILVSNKIMVMVNILLTHKLMCDKTGSYQGFWCYAEATIAGQQKNISLWLPAGSEISAWNAKMTFKLFLLCLVT